MNNITGAGVPALPNLVAESGWLPPLICTLACVLLTSLAAGMFAEAMRRIPGNDAFSSRFEYAGIVRSYAGDRAYLAAQAILYAKMLSATVINIVQACQAMDRTVADLAGRTCGLD